MALSNPVETLFTWVRDRVQGECGTSARVQFVDSTWMDERAGSEARVDLEWGLVPRELDSAVLDLNTSRTEMSFSLIGLWSSKSRTVEWTDHQMTQVRRVQRAMLTEDWPAGVDHFESDAARTISTPGMVVWEIPVMMRCEVED